MKIIAALLAVASCTAFAQNPISGIQVLQDRPTLTSLGFQVLYSGDDNRNASVTWRYRPQGQVTWHTAYPMLRVLPETVAAYAVPKQFAGSIVDLHPSTTYEIEIQVQDPDNTAFAPIATTGATRAVPGEPATPRQVLVSDSVSLQNAVNAAQAGDIILVQPGTYAVQSLSIFASGTAANPILLRGASASGVVFDGGACFCNIIEIYGNYTRVESLTLQNAFQGVRFQTAGSIGNGVRYVTMRNVTDGINGKTDQKDFYIADNTLQGRIAFPATFFTDPNNPYQDTYGIAIYGQGHVVAFNRISSFADAITSQQYGARANDFYGNDIPYTYDDSVQLDRSDGNVRFFRNRMTNVFSGISVQPLNGGPAYVFRNALFNVYNEPFKFHSQGTVPPQEPSGVLVFHNTTVRKDNALNMQAAAANHNSVLMNNLLIGAASSPQAGDWTALLDQVQFDYNGYFPDGQFFFRTPGFAGNVPSLAAVFPAFGLEQHGRTVSATTFANGQTGPALFEQFQSPQDLSLSSTSLALDAGTLLPNFNDDFSGAAPDLGAFERGCPVPAYGPRPPGADESTAIVTCTPATPPTPPSVVSVTPTGRAAATRIFTLTAYDANGAFDIVKLSLAFGSGTGLANSCMVELDRASRQMFLWNDPGTARLGPLTAGSAGLLENSNCQIQGTGSNVTEIVDSKQVVWNANMTFKNAYRQLKTIFGKADDAAALTSGWVISGNWR